MKKNFALIFNIFLFSLLRFTFADGLRCSQLMNSDALFSLEGLLSTNDYIYNISNYTIYYNFCAYSSKKCKNSSAYAIAFPLDSSGNLIESECFRLTSDSYFSNYEYSLLNNNDPSEGIQIHYTNGDVYSQKDSILYESTFQVNCQKESSTQQKITMTSLEIEENSFIFKAESSYGCPIFEISGIYNFIVQSQYILAIIMVVIGALECFLGLYLLGPSLFGIGFLTGFGILLIFFAEFIIKPDSSSGLIWFCIIFCLAVGGGLGYLATSLPKIGFFGLGIWLGIVIAFILNNLVLYLSESNVLLYLLMVIFGALGAVLASWKWKIVCILSTSIIGGYLTIRGFSIFFGYYPDELSIVKKIQYKELDGVGWPFYVYFVFMVGISIAGMIVQFRNRRKGGKFNGEFGMEKDEYFDKDYYEMSLLK